MSVKVKGNSTTFSTQFEMQDGCKTGLCASASILSSKLFSFVVCTIPKTQNTDEASGNNTVVLFNLLFCVYVIQKEQYFLHK